MSAQHSNDGEQDHNEVSDLVAESREVWDTNAVAWDEKIASGGGWQTSFIAPTVERLLAVRPGEIVLDVACGNGVFSRRLAELGAFVVASDFSPRLIELAKARTTDDVNLLEYHVVDATDGAQLLTLGHTAMGERRFDAAVCNMALMDMPKIAPLFEALSRLLKPSGRFVFSVMHPCFNGANASKLVEQSDDTLSPTYSMKVSSYLNPGVTTGMAIPQQPREQYYWHRPLHELFGAGFRAGFVIDAMKEPHFGIPKRSTDRLDWANFDVPPLLFVRMRIPSRHAE